MIELILVIIALLAISFLCSILEAVIFSITRPYIQLLIDSRKPAGKVLHKMKENIDEPITAILTLNTISHTAGAAASGAIASKFFNENWMIVFTAVLTLLILIFSEIIPKTIGANYWKKISPVSAYILKVMIRVLKPLIVPIHFLSNLFSKENLSAQVSRKEILSYLQIGHKQGVLSSTEIEVVENLFDLQNKSIRKIMTPRTVVYWLAPEMTIEQILQEKNHLPFSRIPLYNKHENTVHGFIMRRDVMNKVVEGKANLELKSFALQPEIVFENMSVYKVLNQFITTKVHFAVVLNEHGDYVGIVTLEDAIETLIGQEIVDEFDSIDDMHKLIKPKITE